MAKERKRLQDKPQIPENEAAMAEEEWQGYVRAGMRVMMARLGWSQREAAHRSRIAYRAFNAGVSEEGKNNVSWQVFVRFCRAVGKDPVDVLIIGRSEVRAAQEDRLAQLREEESETLVAEILGEKSSEARERILEMVKETDARRVSKE